MQSLQNFSLDEAEKYTLTVRITDSSFDYSINQIETNEIFLFQENSFSPENVFFEEIQKIIFDSAILTYPYRETNVIFVSKDYELAPQYLIQQDKKNILYDFTHSVPSEQIIYSKEVIQQVVTIFNTNENTYQFLSRNLYNPQFYHHTNVLMKYLELENKDKGDIPKMYINIHDNLVDIFCYDENSKILQAITLENEDEQTIAYYILNIWEKCGFDQSAMPLYFLMGYSTPNIHMISKLKEYIRNIKLIAITKINVPATKNPMPLDLAILSTI